MAHSASRGGGGGRGEVPAAPELMRERSPSHVGFARGAAHPCPGRKRLVSLETRTKRGGEVGRWACGVHLMADRLSSLPAVSPPPACPQPPRVDTQASKGSAPPPPPTAHIRGVGSFYDSPLRPPPTSTLCPGGLQSEPVSVAAGSRPPRPRNRLAAAWGRRTPSWAPCWVCACSRTRRGECEDPTSPRGHSEQPRIVRRSVDPAPQPRVRGGTLRRGGVARPRGLVRSPIIIVGTAGRPRDSPQAFHTSRLWGPAAPRAGPHRCVVPRLSAAVAPRVSPTPPATLHNRQPRARNPRLAAAAATTRR